MTRQQSRGFTLIELVITIVVLAILVTLAAPSFVDTLDRRRVVNATTALTGQIQQARTIAIMQNRNVNMVFQRASPTEWCFGLTDEAVCDCADDGDCTIPVIDPNCDPADPACRTSIVTRSDAFPRMNLELDSSPLTMSFEPSRGIRADENGLQAITFTSPRNISTEVSVSVIGRAFVCSPSGATLTGGIKPCD